MKRVLGLRRLIRFLSFDEGGSARLPLLVCALMQIVWGLNEGYGAYMGSNGAYASSIFHNISAVCCIAAILFMLILDNLRECAADGAFMCFFIIIGRFIAISFPMLMNGIVDFIVTQLPFILLIAAVGSVLTVAVYSAGSTLVVVVGAPMFILLVIAVIAGILGIFGNAVSAMIISVFSLEGTGYTSLIPVFLVLLVCVVVHRYEILKNY